MRLGNLFGSPVSNMHQALKSRVLTWAPACGKHTFLFTNLYLKFSISLHYERGPQTLLTAPGTLSATETFLFAVVLTVISNPFMFLMSSK